MRTKMLGIALAALVLTASAYADAMFETGNHPQPNEENILLNGSGIVIGNPIDGHTNHTHTTVQFSSTTCLPGQGCLSGTGGQSDIDAGPGFGTVLHNVTITVPGHSFQDLIINPFKPVNNTDLVVTVITNTGPFIFTYGDTHGDNFLTITTNGGEVIDSVTIDSTGGFQDLKQPRISGPFAVIPEPSSLLLLGSGVLILLQGFRRKLL